MTRNFFRTPQGAMYIVLAMYVVKAATKISLGTRINSPMLTGDGWHNFADMFEAGFVILMVRMAARPPSDDYPLGRKNAESIMSAVIGAGLLLMAFKLMIESLFGLTSWIAGLENVAAMSPFKHERLIMSTKYFWLVLAVTLGGVVTSILVGRHEVAVGKNNGHDSMVADGKETLSDAMIEGAMVAGVLCEYAFHQPKVEYLFTLAVAVKMTQTGWEILWRGLHALLQKSIGQEREKEIRAIAQNTHGVVGVAELKTFRVGDKVIVIMKLVTRMPIVAQKLMKHAMVNNIVGYLRGHAFPDAVFFIRFDSPDPQPHRIAYAAVWRDGELMQVAAAFDEYTHLLVCSVNDGEVIRIDRVGRAQVEADEKYFPDNEGFTAIRRFLMRKRVTICYVGITRPEERVELARDGICLDAAPMKDFVSFGL